MQLGELYLYVCKNVKQMSNGGIISEANLRKAYKTIIYRSPAWLLEKITKELQQVGWIEEVDNSKYKKRYRLLKNPEIEKEIKKTNDAIFPIDTTIRCLF